MISEAEISIPSETRSLPRARDLESQIGNTPLLALRQVATGLASGVEVLVRLSAFILMCIGIEFLWSGYLALTAAHGL